MADKPDVTVAIDLGTTFTGTVSQYRVAKDTRLLTTLRCGIFVLEWNNAHLQQLAWEQ